MLPQQPALPERPAREELMDLYKTSVDEVHKYHDLYHRRIAFFASLMTTLLTAVAIGFFQAKEWEHYAAIMPAGALLFMIGFVARKAIKGCYRLLLECIVSRAKFEQCLGLTRRQNGLPQTWAEGYWLNESLVPRRHLLDRIRHKTSSQKWVDFFKNDSPHEWARPFFTLVQGLGIMATVFSASLMTRELRKPGQIKEKIEALSPVKNTPENREKELTTD